MNMLVVNNRRPVRARPTVSKTSGSKPVQAPPAVCRETKQAICFLCIFEGLHTPSIRRLIRKQRTFCQKPLLTFDPSFFAPSSERALKEAYAAKGCPNTIIVVDPVVENVQELMSTHGGCKVSHPQRLLVHYFGQGCRPPANGSVSFFSEDRTKYKGIRFANMIKNVQCPLVFVFDCSFAGVMKEHMRKDMFGFFSCGAGEELPLSTDAPMDLFSSCLLNPYPTAIWWHNNRNAGLFERPIDPSPENAQFLESFLMSLLNAISFESQQAEVYEAFTVDPTLSALLHGFVLAQRVMLSFNIHSIAFPALNPMGENSLWNIWDIALDMCAALPKETAEQMLYELCMDTFSECPTEGVIPIFTHFLTIPRLREQTARQLLILMDAHSSFAETGARSSLPDIIMKASEPSESLLLILAKMLASERGVGIRLASSLSSSKQIEVLKVGMLNVCIVLTRNFSSSYNSMLMTCLDHAVDCAPFSGLLLGTLLSHGIRAHIGFAKVFQTLCFHQHEDIRASSVYVLGWSLDPNVAEKIKEMSRDASPLVREQALYAMFNFLKNQTAGITLQDIQVLEGDSDEDIRHAYSALRPSLGSARPGMQAPHANPLMEKLVKSVRNSGFRNRYLSNIFGN